MPAEHGATLGQFLSPVHGQQEPSLIRQQPEQNRKHSVLLKKPIVTPITPYICSKSAGALSLCDVGATNGVICPPPSPMILRLVDLCIQLRVFISCCHCVLSWFSLCFLMLWNSFSLVLAAILCVLYDFLLTLPCACARACLAFSNRPDGLSPVPHHLSSAP